MNVIITGCLGHIGSHLIQNIGKIKKIKKIYLIDNISNNKFISLANLKRSKQKKIFIYDDLSDPKNFFNIKKIDVIIHLASITDAQKSILKKRDYIKNNLGSFQNIIKYCKKNKTRLIHISSTSVYGDPNKIVEENSKY